MSKHILLAPFVAVILSFSSVGFACSLAGYQELNVDQTLPAIVFDDFDVNVQTIKRGANSGSSCDDLGWVVLKIEEVDPEVGYTVELTSGTAPKNLGQHLVPVIPENDGTLMLAWSDEISDDQPPVDFTLLVTAIAPNGDQGPARQVVISDPGTESGCSATGNRDASLLGLMIFGVVFYYRRKR